MQQLLTILHILAAFSVIALVLIQRGKGSDMGASFGAGSSQTMFGSQGATPFLVKLTAIIAFVFFLTCGILSFYVNKLDMPTATPIIGVPTEEAVQPQQMIPTATPQTQEQTLMPKSQDGDSGQSVIPPQ